MGLKEYLATPEGLRYCTESCFFQSRRASFKRTKTCDWCKHIRHAVNYVDFNDGATQLQFCSDKCLNQYKMEIFCKETQAHLDMNPHLKEPNNITESNSLITPELWLNICQEQQHQQQPKTSSSFSDRSNSPKSQKKISSKSVENPSYNVNNESNKIQSTYNNNNNRRNSNYNTNYLIYHERFMRKRNNHGENEPTITERIPSTNYAQNHYKKFIKNHIPSIQNQNSLNVKNNPNSSIPPPILTLTVPYPIVVPLPVPIPIPIPMDLFVQATKRNREQCSSDNNESSASDYNTFSSIENSIDINEIIIESFDEPLDFRIQKNKNVKQHSLELQSDHQNYLNQKSTKNNDKHCAVKKRRRNK